MIDAEAAVAAHAKALEDGLLVEQVPVQVGQRVVSKDRPVAAYVRAPAGPAESTTSVRPAAIQRNSR